MEDEVSHQSRERCRVIQLFDDNGWIFSISLTFPGRLDRTRSIGDTRCLFLSSFLLGFTDGLVASRTEWVCRLLLLWLSLSLILLDVSRVWCLINIPNNCSQGTRPSMMLFCRLSSLESLSMQLSILKWWKFWVAMLMRPRNMSRLTALIPLECRVTFLSSELSVLIILYQHQWQCFHDFVHHSGWYWSQGGEDWPNLQLDGFQQVRISVPGWNGRVTIVLLDLS